MNTSHGPEAESNKANHAAINATKLIMKNSFSFFIAVISSIFIFPKPTTKTSIKYMDHMYLPNLLITTKQVVNHSIPKISYLANNELNRPI